MEPRDCGVTPSVRKNWLTLPRTPLPLAYMIDLFAFSLIYTEAQDDVEQEPGM